MKRFYKITLAVIVMAGVIGGVSVFLGRDKPEEMLVGKISRADLLALPYGDWYQSGEGQYKPENIPELGPLLKDVKITIIMGTWCHDSQREVPYFHKILAVSGADMTNVAMIAVNQDFAAEGLDIKSYGITNTPTFIFHKNGRELNRIVEVPVVSLERDMLAILTGRQYRHAKYIPPPT